MDSLQYMTNKAHIGYKLCNLQYENALVDDNRKKKETIWYDSTYMNGDVSKLSCSALSDIKEGRLTYSKALSSEKYFRKINYN